MDRPLEDYTDAELLQHARHIVRLGISKDSPAARHVAQEAIRRGLVPGAAPEPKVHVVVIDYGPVRG